MFIILSSNRGFVDPVVLKLLSSGANHTLAKYFFHLSFCSCICYDRLGLYELEKFVWPGKILIGDMGEIKVPSSQGDRVLARLFHLLILTLHALHQDSASPRCYFPWSKSNAICSKSCLVVNKFSATLLLSGKSTLT
jgi:hypothetical protein